MRLTSSLFFNSVIINDKNKKIIKKLDKYTNENPGKQVYIINAPLGANKYSYRYQENAIVILSPKQKIIFLNLINNNNDFNEYYEEFIEDLGSISDKFDYKEYIGRPRKWQRELTICEQAINGDIDVNQIFEKNRIINSFYRKNELLISLLVGSINNIEKIGIEEPEYLLEKVRKKIILFDGEQTRFIYKEINKKIIYIQGLSGTGKTELLLHKLKEIYSLENDVKIFFTCHNIALANTLRKRIPNFFNFMKVEKQIKWNELLWTDRAWGAMKDPNSGLYSYICHFYGIPFYPYGQQTNYRKIFTQALEEINKIEPKDFKHAFDYILIDESQDFPDIFFKLCEKITRKQVYVAGDIFQDIFSSNFEKRVIDVDFILNRCYRTDPRTLMFSHAIGMGLFEENKLNWLTDKEWNASGYQIKREKGNVYLYRETIRRFSDLENENIDSVIIEKLDSLSQIVSTINKLKKENPTIEPDDIAIIILDDDNTIYDFINRLEFEIMTNIGWEVNKSYETKEKIDNSIFVSNRNNVKGLEFPFVICITNDIKDNYQYRNTLYTMLTRSFIQSYLFISNDTKLEDQRKGLEIINTKNCIKTSEPSETELSNIKNTIIKIKENNNLSYQELLNQIFFELKIDQRCREEMEKHIPAKLHFNKEGIINFIKKNKEFYC